MTWHNTPLPYNTPPEHYLRTLTQAGERNYCLLHSTLTAPHSGRYSFLAAYPHSILTPQNLHDLAPHISQSQAWYEQSWFGYFGYGLKNSLENLPADRPNIDRSFISAWPDIWLMQPRAIIRWDHTLNQCQLWHHPQQDCHALLQPTPQREPATWSVSHLQSPMSTQQYKASVAAILADIAAGTLYQANLTRKFTGLLSSPASHDAVVQQLFSALCTASPAPYSSLISMNGRTILSSSPEQFLHITPDGHIESRPIKGTAPRHADPAQDAASKATLAASTKDKAENLMIVDLMRHDLSRICRASSVQVSALHEVASYSTVHHMASTIHGQLSEAISPLDAIRACFPPGSMTGAPKIKAMQHCTELESLPRGVYSGAIGWLGGDGSLDLSVVIRTLCLQEAAKHTQLEFQVGGGIVADSQAESEWHETLHKARGICAALGISTKDLETL